MTPASTSYDIGMLKTLLACSLLCPLSQLIAQDASEKAPALSSAPWIQLFNGTDLTGWTPKFTGFPLGENLRDTFTVKDGLLTVDYQKWETFNGEFGHLYYEKPFSNYHLRATYRFVGDQVAGGPQWAIRNNGLMLHCQDPGTLLLDQKFPASIEVQLLGGLGKGDRPTLAICTPGTHIHWEGKLEERHVIPTGGPTFQGDQWVTVEVEVRGDHFKHLVNGKTVCSYDGVQLNDGTPLRQGWISIQAETAPIQFQSIELKELTE